MSYQDLILFICFQTTQYMIIIVYKIELPDNQTIYLTMYSAGKPTGIGA